MATKSTSSTSRNTSAPPPPAADAVEQKILALAEQVGRVVGTVQAKAEGWLDQQSLRDQLARIRETAGDVLTHLAAGHAEGRKQASKAQAPKAPPRATGADPAHAPGKKHRAPVPTTHGVKHSDSRVAKLRGTKLIRRPQRHG